MSSNARWESIEIVGPLNPNREQDLIGGLKNAMERGEPMEKAKQSFINAGYQPSEVTAAAQKTPVVSPVVTPTTSTQPTTKKEKPVESTQPTPTTPNQPTVKKQASKKFIIILTMIGGLILAGAALLGIFWDKIFG